MDSSFLRTRPTLLHTLLQSNSEFSLSVSGGCPKKGTFLESYYNYMKSYDTFHATDAMTTRPEFDVSYIFHFALLF